MSAYQYLIRDPEDDQWLRGQLNSWTRILDEARAFDTSAEAEACVQGFKLAGTWLIDRRLRHDGRYYLTTVSTVTCALALNTRSSRTPE